MKKFVSLLHLILAFQYFSFGQGNTFDCSTSDCTCTVTVELQNVGSNPFQLITFFYGETGSGELLCLEEITQPGTYQFTIDRTINGNPIDVGLSLGGNLGGVQVRTALTGCDLNEETVLSVSNNAQLFLVDQPCDGNRDCSTTDCTCTVTIDLQNIGTNDFENVAFFFSNSIGGEILCLEEVNEAGVYEFIIDGNLNGNPVEVGLSLGGNLGGVQVRAGVTGCGLSEETILSVANVTETYAVNESCNPGTDCSSTDCTCELTIEVSNATEAFILDLGLEPTLESCITITENGTYTVTSDAVNVSYLLAYAASSSNLSAFADVKITGCGITIEERMSLTNPFVSINIDTECETDCMNFPVPDPAEGLPCELGSFCINCDSSVTITGSSLVSKIKIWNVTAAGCNSTEVMGDWNGVRCELCDEYANEPCDGVWTFPAGTITANNNIFLEFQATIDDGNGFPCGSVYTSNISNPYYNLSAQFARMIENGDCDGESQERISINSLSPSALTSGVRVFPNPANDYLNIASIRDANQVVQILNTNGQELFRGNISQGSSTVSLSGISAGIYYIHISDESTGEKTHVERIVVLK